MKHDFSNLSIIGLRKAGDIILPGQKGLPSFSQTDFINHLGRMTHYMYQDDREGLKLLTSLMALMPSFMVRFILWIVTFHNSFPSPIAPIMRQINIGVRGVLFTLYYSGLEDKKEQGRKIFSELKYDASIKTPITTDDEMEKLLQENNPLLAQQIGSKAPREMKPEEVPFIFEKAQSARGSISAMSINERLTYTERIRHVLLSRQEEIIDVVQKETNKCRTDILTSEFFPIFEHLDFLVHSAKKALKNETVPTPIAMMGKKSEIWFEPLGTILIISPWNYPLYQAIVPITCSFITGNATVYKPSEITPLTGLIESILADAGMKADWCQIVYGDGKIGAELIKERPQKVFFTGSVATGKKIMASAAQLLVPVELELGGKDPMLVFEDVNINRAVKGAAWGGLTTSGQSCTSVERLYVQENIYDKFKESLVEEVKSMKMGVDQDGDADMGGMISKRQVEIVADLVKDALAQGATLLTGKDWDFKNPMIPPMVIEGTTHKMRINQEEIFGPVITLMKFKTEEEAIRLANDSTFGLSASVWTKDKDRARRVSSKIITGNISINNVMLSEGNHHLPFGGTKDSGIGRYKGIHGLRSFCNVKSVLIDTDSKKIEANWYPYTPTKYKLFSSLMQGMFSGGIKKWAGLVRFGLPLESEAQKAKRK